MKDWLSAITAVANLIGRIIGRGSKEVTASPKDIAVGQSSGEAASRSGKMTSRAAKERK